jgi:hypothetical protein
MLRPLLIVSLALGLLQTGWADAPDKPTRTAIDRALPLLERAAAGSADQRECFTCHNQALPILALSEARRYGFAVDADNFRRQLEHTFGHLDRSRQRYLDGIGTGGKADTAGYALWALSAGDWPPDETTSAVAEYLLLWQADDDHWTCTSDRPPSESSHFTTTYLGIRGLQAYGTDAQQERIASRLQSARDWLIATPPEENEDQVFRLWGLKLAGADEAVVASAASELLGRQCEDGGWAQLDGADSDAYATATALVALHRTDSLQPDADVYRRGVAYLLRSQLEDGSWHVVSRSHPFQSYYESGFPHGEDQFISTAASAWAVLALLATLPPPPADPAPRGPADPKAGGEAPTSSPISDRTAIP